MTNSIGREPNVAVVVDKFGFNSPESRGVFAIFIIGTVIGTIFISFVVTLSLSFLLNSLEIDFHTDMETTTLTEQAIVYALV